MKTIGLIGGMSWESSDLYYQILNRKVQQTLGGVHSCQSLMYSVDFAEIAELQHQNNWDKLSEIMIAAAQRLEKGGADFILLCTNTMHKVAENIQQNINIPLLHIVDTTAEEIQKKSLKKVGLIATKFSMEGDFLRSRYKSNFDIDTVIPNEIDRNVIHEIIYNELVKGIINQNSKQKFLEIIDKLIDQGAKGIISGCTEIELLIKPIDIRVELFETTRLHAEKAVELALKNSL
jgi:aspartate racemase